MAKLSIQLRREVNDALLELVERWYPGQKDKRNAVIQRAILEAAQREE